jgi:hypothetical protein
LNRGAHRKKSIGDQFKTIFSLSKQVLGPAGGDPTKLHLRQGKQF